MTWVSAVETADSFETAFQSIHKSLKKKLGRSKADFGLIFVSSRFRQEMVDLWPEYRKTLPIKNLIGCTAGGVIGASKEVENKAAISITAAILPRVKVHPFSIQQKAFPSADGSPRPWRDLVKVPGKKIPHFILLSDPFSIDSDTLVEGLDFAYPNSVKVGGLASGGTASGENLLIINEKLHHSGTIGVALEGEIAVEPVVAQGCRPIGKPMAITSCEDNILINVDDKAPLQYLSDLYPSLSPRDQSLFTSSLFIGILMDPFKKNPRQGDFLIRNIIGVDQEKGLLAIGALLRSGQTIQFHLRDANTSRDDLKLMLAKSSAADIKGRKNKKPAGTGAVLFSCMGRGKSLYGKSNHDVSLLKALVGDIPIGGFFCSGEIGPVNGRTYLHGYTSSIAIFSPTKKSKKRGAKKTASK